MHWQLLVNNWYSINVNGLTTRMKDMMIFHSLKCPIYLFRLYNCLNDKLLTVFSSLLVINRILTISNNHYEVLLELKCLHIQLAVTLRVPSAVILPWLAVCPSHACTLNAVEFLQGVVGAKCQPVPMKAHSKHLQSYVGLSPTCALLYSRVTVKLDTSPLPS